MAKVRPNYSVGTINGKLGKLVFVHCEDGRILVRQAPLRRAEFTPPELRNHGQTVLVHVTATDWAGNTASKTLYQALVATG